MSKKPAPKRLKTPQPAKANKPNAEWFKMRMRDMGLDRPAVARALDVPENTVWLMTSGKRRVQLEEISVWAKLLDVAYLEIVRQFGVAVPDHTVPVTGVLRPHGRITPLSPDKVYRVPAPPDVGMRGTAIQIEGAHTAFALFEGAHLYYEPTGNVAVDAFDRLSVVELAEHGSAPVVGLLTRGSLKHVRIVVFGGLETIESQQLIGAWPVRWQRMG